MKKIFFVSAFLVCAFFMNAQNTFKGSFLIKNNKQTSNTEFIETAILKSNLEPYRLREARTTLTFENGFEIELLAANELKSVGVESDIYSYNKEFAEEFVLPVFKIAEGGFVVAKHQTITKEHSH